ncbi:MAG: hypothetical protein ACRELD_08385 [Longimicrobiales bacterium]
MPQHEDLARIRELMADAQRVVQDNGVYFIGWGVVTVIGLAVTYAVLSQGLPATVIWGTWGALVALGWLLTAVQARRRSARAPVTTLAGRLVGELWGGIGLAITVTVFGGGLAGAIPGQAIPGVVSALAGAAFFSSASLYPLLPLRLLAAGWWVGALAMFVWPGAYTLLLMAALVLLLQIAPGVVLWRRASRAPGV